MKIQKFSKPAKLYAIVCRDVTEFYKTLHITLHVLKIFEFLFRYLPLEVFGNFLTKMFSVMLRSPFQIGVCK